VRIRPKYSATIAFLWQEDKEETKQSKQTNKTLNTIENIADEANLPAVWTNNFLRYFRNDLIVGMFSSIWANSPPYFLHVDTATVALDVVLDRA